MLLDSLRLILESLPSHDISNYAEIFKEKVLAEGAQALAKVTYNSDRYTRTILHQVKDFDVVLIGWSPGQSSPIHNHPTNGCLVYPIQGELLEERYCDKLNPLSQTIIGVGKHSYIDDGICLHRLGNASETESAVSIHIYSPSNFVATIFKPEGQEQIIGTPLS